MQEGGQPPYARTSLRSTHRAGTPRNAPSFSFKKKDNGNRFESEIQIFADCKIIDRFVESVKELSSQIIIQRVQKFADVCA